MATKAETSITKTHEKIKKVYQERLVLRANDCIKRAAAPWGCAWDKLTPDMRRAFVMDVVCGVIAGQDDPDGKLQRAIDLIDTTRDLMKDW